MFSFALKTEIFDAMQKFLGSDLGMHLMAADVYISCSFLYICNMILCIAVDRLQSAGWFSSAMSI